MIREKSQSLIYSRKAAELSRGFYTTIDNLIKVIQTIETFIYNTD